MKFEINFNREDKNDTDDFYEFIGAKKEYNVEVGYTNFVEVASLEELEELMNKINMKLAGNTFEYAAVILFDPNTIYLDDKV